MFSRNPELYPLNASSTSLPPNSLINLGAKLPPVENQWPSSNQCHACTVEAHGPISFYTFNCTYIYQNMFYFYFSHMYYYVVHQFLTYLFHISMCLGYLSMLSSFGFVLFLFNGIISVVGICHSLCIHNICYWTFKIFFLYFKQFCNECPNSYFLMHTEVCTRNTRQSYCYSFPKWLTH